MTKKPTIKTIAAMAGVSHVAVSKALRGCPDISKATTEKIKKIADEIGYMPNAFARNLSSKRSYTIGMIVPTMGNGTAYNDIFNSISEAAAAEGLNVILGSCNRNVELEKVYCRNMCENRVGALIVAPTSENIDHIKELCKETVPLILLGGKVKPEDVNYIDTDYNYSAELAVEYLYKLGHRDIALFLYHPDNQTVFSKIEGYTAAMESHKLKPRVYRGGDSSDIIGAGRMLTQKLIDEKTLPTAIWCAGDIMGLGVIDCLQSNNIRVTEDVSVIGHDNLSIASMKHIMLTTFALPDKQIGKSVVDMAIKIMNRSDDAEHAPKRLCETFHAELVERNTTGKCPVKKR